MHLGYIILYVKDIKETIDFYKKAFLLNLKFLNDTEEYAEMDTGGTTLAFASEKYYQSDGLNFKPNRIESDPSGFEISLVTNDVYKAFETAVENGAIKIIEPHKKPWGQIVSCVKDNNGILVSICNWPAKEIKVTGE